MRGARCKIQDAGYRGLYDVECGMQDTRYRIQGTYDAGYTLPGVFCRCSQIDCLRMTRVYAWPAGGREFSVGEQKLIRA